MGATVVFLGALGGGSSVVSYVLVWTIQAVRAPAGLLVLPLGVGAIALLGLGLILLVPALVGLAVSTGLALWLQDRS